MLKLTCLNQLGLQIMYLPDSTHALSTQIVEEEMVNACVTLSRSWFPMDNNIWIFEVFIYFSLFIIFSFISFLIYVLLNDRFICIIIIFRSIIGRPSGVNFGTMWRQHKWWHRSTPIALLKKWRSSTSYIGYSILLGCFHLVLNRHGLLSIYKMP